MTVAFDRPVREITVRAGTQTNCGGFAQISADFEPADEFAFVDAHDPQRTGSRDQQLIDACVTAVCRGVVEELTSIGQGELPAVRFVLRRVLVHEVDSVDFRNVQAGRKAAIEAVRRLGEAS
ncbi:hypothetical protein [Actinoplanes sp. DH11]|uniref:hypothetical protein n=1 Tax=Actinoplanes sp. DH11 TaxID=2857011 RepID=UPI001E577000|nr:hypothetical protein [Actinoplanes sp. DH11]